MVLFNTLFQRRAEKKQRDTEGDAERERERVNRNQEQDTTHKHIFTIKRIRISSILIFHRKINFAYILIKFGCLFDARWWHTLWTKQALLMNLKETEREIEAASERERGSARIGDKEWIRELEKRQRVLFDSHHLKKKAYRPSQYTHTHIYIFKSQMESEMWVSLGYYFGKKLVYTQYCVSFYLQCKVKFHGMKEKKRKNEK